MEQFLATDFAKEALEASANGGGAFVIGGDFNEPSHLDWTEATRSVLETWSKKSRAYAPQGSYLKKRF